MKAILSIRPGGPESLVIEDCPVPSLQPGEVRVAVKACSVNYPDVLMIQDLYQGKAARPFSPGGDIAGVVEAVSEGVQSVKIGDRIAATIRTGGMAEFAAVSAVNCFRIPDAMTFDTASSLLTTYATSYYALHNRAHLQAGDTVLVLGAAGGVGIAAVELAKAAGARVVAAASSPEKVALARKHGADEGVIYARGPFDKAGARELADQFKASCGPGGANVIYDAVGGDYAEAALRAIAWDGRYLVVGFTAGIPKIPMNLPLLKSCQIVGVFWGADYERNPQLKRTHTEKIFRLYEQDAIHPVITERFPLYRAADAIARLANREATGKIVVMVDSG